MREFCTIRAAFSFPFLRDSCRLSISYAYAGKLAVARLTFLVNPRHIATDCSFKVDAITPLLDHKVRLESLRASTTLMC